MYRTTPFALPLYGDGFCFLLLKIIFSSFLFCPEAKAKGRKKLLKAMMITYRQRTQSKPHNTEDLMRKIFRKTEQETYSLRLWSVVLSTTTNSHSFAIKVFSFLSPKTPMKQLIHSAHKHVVDCYCCHHQKSSRVEIEKRSIVHSSVHSEWHAMLSSIGILVLH